MANAGKGFVERNMQLLAWYLIDKPPSTMTDGIPPGYVIGSVSS